MLDMDMDTTLARGLLMLSPRLMLRLMLLFSMEAMGILVLDILVLDMLVLDMLDLDMLALAMLDMDTPMLDMDVDTTLARGLLMLSQKLKLRLTPLFFMELMAMLVLVMQDMPVLDMLAMLVLDIELMLDIPTPMGLMLDILMPGANKP